MGALRGRDQDFTATYSKLKARPSTPQAGGGKKIWNRDPVHLTAMMCPELAHRTILRGFQTDAEKRAEVAAMQHDASPSVSALGIVARERCVDIVAVAPGFAQTQCIAAGPGHPESYVRSRSYGSIAHGCDAAKYRARRGEIVDRREEGLLDIAQDVEEGRRHDLLGFADQWRQHGEFYACAPPRRRTSL